MIHTWNVIIRNDVCQVGLRLTEKLILRRSYHRAVHLGETLMNERHASERRTNWRFQTRRKKNKIISRHLVGILGRVKDANIVDWKSCQVLVADFVMQKRPNTLLFSVQNFRVQTQRHKLVLLASCCLSKNLMCSPVSTTYSSESVSCQAVRKPSEIKVGCMKNGGSGRSDSWQEGQEWSARVPWWSPGTAETGAARVRKRRSGIQSVSPGDSWSVREKICEARLVKMDRSPRRFLCCLHSFCLTAVATLLHHRVHNQNATQWQTFDGLWDCFGDATSAVADQVEVFDRRLRAHGLALCFSAAVNFCRLPRTVYSVGKSNSVMDKMCQLRWPLMSVRITCAHQ